MPVALPCRVEAWVSSPWLFCHGLLDSARVAPVGCLEPAGVAQPEEVFFTEPTGSVLQRIDATRTIEQKSISSLS